MAGGFVTSSDTTTGSGSEALALRGAAPGGPLLHTIPLAMAALAVALCIGVAVYLPGSDEDVFRYVGYAWSRTDDLPYRDAFENKPPGVFALWGLVWVCFDGAPVAGRLAGVAATCASALLLGSLAARLWSKQAGVVTAVLFLSAMCSRHFEFPFGDTETFGTFFSLAALYLIWPSEHWPVTVPRAALAGALCGIAVLFKQVFLIELLVVLAVGALGPGRVGRRSVLVGVVLTGALLPVLGCLAYFKAHNALGEFFEVVIGALGSPGAVPGAPLLDRMLRASSIVLEYFAMPTVVAVLALGACAVAELRRRERRTLGLLCLAWALGILLAILVQGRAYQHQFRQALAPLCLLAAGGLPALGVAVGERSGPAQPRSRMVGCLVVAAMALTLLSTVRDLSDEALTGERDAWYDATQARPDDVYPSLEVAVEALTGPEDRIWCYPRPDPYARTRRLSASRCFTAAYLSRPQAQEDVLRSLTQGRARLVVLDADSAAYGAIPPSFEPSDRPAFHRKLADVLQQHFVLRGHTGPWSIYEFRGERSPG
jgi:hypothetical protein